MSSASNKSFKLRVLAGEAELIGREFDIEDGVATIGRDKGSTIVITDVSVSRKHALVESTPEGVKVRDLNSGNGVWVGDHKVTEQVLKAGQSFRIGATIIEFEPAVAEQPAAASEVDAGDRTMVMQAPVFTNPPAAETPPKPAAKEPASPAAPKAEPAPPAAPKAEPAAPKAKPAEPAAPAAEPAPPAPPATPPPSPPPPTPAPAAAAGGAAAAAAVEPEPEPEPEPPVDPYLLKVIKSGDLRAVNSEIELTTRVATVGRGYNCDLILNAEDLSRTHAQIEVVDDGFVLTDLDSTNGTWVDDIPIMKPEKLEAGQQFRIGRTTIIEVTYPEYEESDVEEDLADRTIIMQVAGPKPVDLKNYGEEIIPLPHRPFVADDGDAFWYVETGQMDLFTVSLEHGKPSGARHHFLQIREGRGFFGFDASMTGGGSGFLAVSKKGTRLRKLTVKELRGLAVTGRNAESIGPMLDAWVRGMSERLTRDIGRDDAAPERELKAGETVEIGEEETIQRLSAADDDEVVWLPIWNGSHLYVDMAMPTFHDKSVLFPITRRSWIQPISGEFADSTIITHKTDDNLANEELWEGLEVFHQVLCECEFINKKLATVDEYIRLQDKAAHSEAAREAARGALGSVLRTEAERPEAFLQAGDAEPVFNAVAVVAAHIGMEVNEPPETDEPLSFEEQLLAIGSMSGFRTRMVALRGEWWSEDHGAFLVTVEDTNRPVAVLPTSASSYDIVDPSDGSRHKVTPELANQLSAFGYTLYRPFPDGELAVMDIVKFGARGLKNDFRWLLAMGIVVGMLGMATPYFTGKIIDEAIPQSDGGMLFGFAGAVIAASIATAMFKIVQGVSTVRVQGKMEGAIQSGVWDRLLNLPTSFFRKYSAGDLADRAGGVDQIQQLISGAGIAAILGSFSGLFYVVQMLTYNSRLAMVAVALTAFFVAFTMTCNYLQLRHQRKEIAMRGYITGLVLNLITGVTKLRVSGAEPHAFRIWAQNFSAQRKVSFSIGRIQNAVQVFSDIFPVISSITIFYVMLQAQQEAAQTGQSVLSPGDFIAFNAAYGAFLGSMQALGDASLSMLRVVPIYERLKPILTTEPEIDSSKSYPGKLTGRIEIANAWFRYSEDGPWICQDFSLKIEPGEFVAFVGGSGCGKSTVMRLMLGFETPQRGAVLYDGQDISGVDLRLLRQQMGVVLQVSQVLPTDIYRNIVGASSRSIEDAWEAAEAAGLAEDIRNMPMQMHTYISEGGGTMSGGQRQRLLIARAVVNKPKILFLDEATSALDNRSQAQVTESMDRMDATRIAIAHRLSTIINADKICYLEGGKVAEMGTYDELIELDGKFAELAKLQEH